MTSTLQDLEDGYFLAAGLLDALAADFDDDPEFEAVVRERAETARARAFAAARAEVRASALPLGEFARLAQMLHRLAAIEGCTIPGILEVQTVAT